VLLELLVLELLELLDEVVLPPPAPPVADEVLLLELLPPPAPPVAEDVVPPPPAADELEVPVALVVELGNKGQAAWNTPSCLLHTPWLLSS